MGKSSKKFISGMEERLSFLSVIAENAITLIDEGESDVEKLRYWVQILYDDLRRSRHKDFTYDHYHRVFEYYVPDGIDHETSLDDTWGKI